MKLNHNTHNELEHTEENNVISFHSEEIDFEFENESTIAGWLSFCVRDFDFTLGELSYIFCSDEYLHQMNVKYLNHDTYTDIITFDYTEEKQVNGDLFISIDRVRENASKYQVTFQKELNRVMVHGLLHLMGFKDKSDADADLMRKKEDYCLTLLKN